MGRQIFFLLSIGLFSYAQVHGSSRLECDLPSTKNDSSDKGNTIIISTNPFDINLMIDNELQLILTSNYASKLPVNWSQCSEQAMRLGDIIEYTYACQLKDKEYTSTTGELLVDLHQQKGRFSYTLRGHEEHFKVVSYFFDNCHSI